VWLFPRVYAGFGLGLSGGGVVDSGGGVVDSGVGTGGCSNLWRRAFGMFNSFSVWVGEGRRGGRGERPLSIRTS